MSDKDLYNEKELLRQIAEGNEQAFSQLFAIYAKLLYPFLYNIGKSQWMAEEFIQETMLKVWLHRDKLPEIEYPRAWIYRISSNLALSYIQKKLVEERATTHLKMEVPVVMSEIEEYITLKKLQECIQAAIQQLPTQRKIIFQLSRVKGLSRAEIAEELNISEKTVKNAMNAALRSIREYLQRSGYLVSIFYIIFLQK